MESKLLPEGSGKRALQENEMAMHKAATQLQELQTRLESGDNSVEAQIQALTELIEKLRQDRGRINDAGY